MTARLATVVGVVLLGAIVGCNQNRVYERSVTFKQGAYLQPPEVQLDLSQVPADWVTTRQKSDAWGDSHETIEFANAHNRRVKIIVVPLEAPTQASKPAH